MELVPGTRVVDDRCVTQGTAGSSLDWANRVIPWVLRRDMAAEVLRVGTSSVAVLLSPYTELSRTVHMVDGSTDVAMPEPVGIDTSLTSVYTDRMLRNGTEMSIRIRLSCGHLTASGVT